MTDGRRLELRTTDDDQVHATIRLLGDVVEVEGEQTARRIIDSWARALRGSDADAFEYLWRAGWANGPVALVPVGGKDSDESDPLPM